MTDKKEVVKVDTSLMTFDDDKVQLIKNTVAQGATDNELKLFLHQAARIGLDPLSRQIYFIKDKSGKVMTQTSIDGFRVVAERSGDYAGQDEPEFIEENGKLICAKVRVYKWHDGERFQAAVGVAYWSEYAGSTPGYMWNKMPHTMLAKVAEALALRKAFPQDLSGLYSSDEMDQANTDIPEAKVVDQPKAEEWQLGEIIKLSGQIGHSEDEGKNIVVKYWNLVKFEDITSDQAGKTIDALHKKLGEIKEMKSRPFDAEPKIDEEQS